MQLNIIWTDKITDRLLQYNNEGNSLSLIAQKINEEFKTDFTRSGVSGKLHRLGMNSKGIIKIVRKKSHWSIKDTKPPLVDPLPLRIMDLDNKFMQCRYPVTSPAEKADTLFCGLPVYCGSWCRQHTKLCYSVEYLKKMGIEND